MDTHQLLELYKGLVEFVLTCLQEKTCTADEFAKLQELQKKIPSQTDCEDTAYKDFVKTSNLVRGRLDTQIRKVDDCGLVLKRIWKIRKTHIDKMKVMSTTLTDQEETSHFKKYLKVIIAMEKMIESIGKMDEIPVKSPADASSQALSQERKETENVSKNQKSTTDVHKEDSVDEDNQDDVIGDNSNSIHQQPITDEQEMNTKENKEPQNEDVVKDDGSKLREELCQTKTDLDELKEMSDTQKEKQDRMIKELEKLRNECDRLEAEVKNLEEMNTGLKDENERHKMYQKEYNKVTEENTADQERCKAYDIYISKLKEENEKLTIRFISKEEDYNKAKEEIATLQQRSLRPQTASDSRTRQYRKLQEKIATLTAEKESLMQRSQRPQTAPHSSARLYKELQNQIDTLKAEKESLMQRLSMVAGMKMRDNNPGIADLSDPNRPEKLAEQFREIYDNAWTNLLDYITDNTDATDDIVVQQIVTATQKIFEKCQKEIGDMKLQLLKSIGYPEDTFEKQYTGGKDGHDPVVKMMKDLVQISAERIYERVLQKMKEIGEIKSICQIGGESADVFLTKCSKLCLFMCVKDPPVVLDFNFKRGDPFNKDKLSAFTKAGDSVDYLVWPVMYLNENGPVMSKGVAQGRKK